MYCLNLPKHLRYKKENIFVVGITPAPSSPDCRTIDHVLDPTIDKFVRYGDLAGVQVRTYHNPEGVSVRVRIAPVLADSPARVLISGFMGHRATNFCAYCLCTQDNIESLDPTTWTVRQGATVRQEAAAWKNAQTLKRRNELEKTNGVRWTSLHRLQYWDPVKHVVLGYMHNWLEGVLQHHLRVLWGVGRDKAHQDKVKEIDNDELWHESDLSESGSELEDLYREAEEFDSQSSLSTSASTQASPPRSPTESSSSMSLDSPWTHSQPGTPRAPSPEGQNIEDPEDGDYVGIPGAYNLPKEHLNAVRECIRDITLPTWVGRPPANLGEASHGKLRANDYLVLFSFILPLIAPEFWHGSASQTDDIHLENFKDLVVCTNIICSFQTSNVAADLYTHLYTRYRRNIRALFHTWHSVPNHHFAMHNGSLLKHWGPLPALSEFPGERLIGDLQNINTNSKIGKTSAPVI